MNALEIPCVGNKWQDDVEPHIGHFYRYFQRCASGERNKDYVVQDAVLNVMEKIRRLWSPGKTLRIAFKFSWYHARTGGCLLVRRRQGNGKNVDVGKGMRQLHAAMKAKQNALDSELDYRTCLAETDELTRACVCLFMEGYSLAEIKRITRTHYRKLIILLERFYLALIA